jgi:hypothetical protein
MAMKRVSRAYHTYPMRTIGMASMAKSLTLGLRMSHQRNRSGHDAKYAKSRQASHHRSASSCIFMPATIPSPLRNANGSLSEPFDT